METKASAKYIRMSARKARLVADLIRGKGTAEAQQILDYSPKAAAREYAKVLNAAIANAEHNNGLDADNLYVARVWVDEGPTLKRYRPRAMGRATRINKRTCHMNIILDEREPREGEKRRRLRRKPKPAPVEQPVSEEIEEIEELEGTDEVAEAADEATGMTEVEETAAEEGAPQEAEAADEELAEAEADDVEAEEVEAEDVEADEAGDADDAGEDKSESED